MKHYTQACNLFWIFLGVPVCIHSMQLKLWGRSGPEGGFVPFIAGLLLVVGGLSMLILEGQKRSKEKVKGRGREDRKSWERIFYVLVGFCAMAYFMPVLGFLITSTLVLTFLFQLIQPQKWFKAILVAILCCASFYFFFNLFQIRLPKGILSF